MLKHLAIIMDGNRRWARSQGLPTLEGHRKGGDNAIEIARACIQRDISYLTLYLFSLENFKRSPEEKSYIFELMARGLQEHAAQFIEQGVRLTFIGDRSYFPAQIAPTIAELELQTKECNKLHLQLLFCYGGQQEIVAAARQIAVHVAHGTLMPSDITVESFQHYLWSAEIPHPDAILRTGNEHRLSNFLLFQAAYSELFFSPLMWPDFTVQELDRLIEEFRARKRNFGV